jgi:DNA-binding LytR/AlgR family response regulator
MLPIQILIADDQYYERILLRHIIDQYGGFEIIGEAADGIELVDLASKKRAHVIFADVEMPGMDGMAAIKQIVKEYEDILVVFVTGYADFAVQAFEISSFDYILKPFLPERVTKTLDKIYTHITEKRKAYLKTAKDIDKLFIKVGHAVNFIDQSSILFIEKQERKTVILTRENTYETNDPINEIEKRLDPSRFFRGHKSYVINLKQIESILPHGNNSYRVKFYNSTADALVSRSNIKALNELLGLP